MAAVYRLEDLSARDLLDAGHARPARLAVIGYPVSHSASPAMHQPALDERGLAMRYVRVEVVPGQVAEAFSRMADMEFVGCNVTVPHKFEALEACDAVELAAQELGAVNTVRFLDGRAHGSNTDGPGFARAVREEFGVALRELRVMVVGAGGGAGNAIAIQCAREGCVELVVANRSVEKLPPLLEKLAPLLAAAGGTARPRAVALDDDSLREVADACDLIVNCTSLGLRPGDPSPLPPACFVARHMVYDTVYQPPRTAFSRAAVRAGARVANGGSMLLHQGALSFETWFGGRAPIETMRAGLAQARRDAG